MHKLKNHSKITKKLSSCIICNKKIFSIWAKKDSFVARKCTNCGMISINPRPSNADVEKFYQGYYIIRQDKQKLWKQREQAYLIDRDFILNFLNKGKILDVGCSGGHFLSTFNSKNWKKFGVEIEQSPADHARKLGIDVKVGDLTELNFSQKFDLVMMRGVIEHFSDPLSILKKCAQITKIGGYLYITATPVGDSFAFDVFREKWNQFVPPLHLHFFTVKQLSKILKKLDFELVSEHYQYEETPYANPKNDFNEMKKAIILSHQNKNNKIKVSPPFPGTMMTAVWKKQK